MNLNQIKNIKINGMKPIFTVKRSISFLNILMILGIGVIFGWALRTYHIVEFGGTLPAEGTLHLFFNLLGRFGGIAGVAGGILAIRKAFYKRHTRIDDPNEK